MNLASVLFASALPLFAAQEPAAPPATTEGAPPAAAAATAENTPAAPPARARQWRVSRIEVPGATGTRQEIRVLRADETAVSLAEGLSDIGESKRLADRAARLDDTQNSWQSITGRVVVLAVGGALTVAGALGAVLGAGFWAWSAGGTSSLPTQVESIVLQGPSIMLTGLIAGAIGLFTVAVTAGLWAWFLVRGPAPADPAVVQALGAQLGWTEAEAQEVVARHNASADSAPAAK
jgi:hypothetical protein